MLIQQLGDLVEKQLMKVLEYKSLKNKSIKKVKKELNHNTLHMDSMKNSSYQNPIFQNTKEATYYHNGLKRLMLKKDQICKQS